MASSESSSSSGVVDVNEAAAAARRLASSTNTNLAQQQANAGWQYPYYNMYSYVTSHSLTQQSNALVFHLSTGCLCEIYEACLIASFFSF
jgi:hypothetical protein